MICPQCGKELPQNAVFCGDCGASLPAKKEKKPFPLKIVLCVVLAVSLLLNLFFLIRPLFGKQKVVFEGKGYNTPEEAITAYAEAFKDGDVDKMISTFAVESYVDNFDLEKYTEQNGIYLFNNNDVSLPNDSDYKVSINHYTRLSRITQQIINGYYVLTGIDNENSYISLPRREEGAAQAFLDQLEYPNFDKELSNMEIGDVLVADDFDIDKQMHSTQFDYLDYLDVTEFCDVAIEIEFDGQQYYLFMLTAKIDGKWYNISTTSPLGLQLDMSSRAGGLLKK